MLISEIKASVIMLQSSNNDFIEIDNNNKIITPENYKGTLLIDLFYAISILTLENDLRNAVGVDKDYNLSDILTNHEGKLELALSYLQLFNLYFEYDEGEGSKSHSRMLYYKREYELMKSNFYKYLDLSTPRFENIKVYK